MRVMLMVLLMLPLLALAACEGDTVVRPHGHNVVLPADTCNADTVFVVVLETVYVEVAIPLTVEVDAKWGNATVLLDGVEIGKAPVILRLTGDAKVRLE